jgi:hypothetical protein
MARRKSSKIAAKVGDAADDAKAKLNEVEGPSPNPMTNLILTDLVLRAGGQIMRHTVEKSLLKTKYDAKKAKNIIAGRSLTQTLVATAVARIATRSVPGMIVVGGASLAKLLYDRSQSKREERADGRKAVAEQVARGAKE